MAMANKQVERLAEELHPRHEHHFHNYRGPMMMMVLPDGHVFQKCCECSETRTIHAEHA